MGAVYRGRDDRLAIDVAVKVLPFHVADTNPGLVERFVREARMAARVDHPNLVRVYTVGEEQGIHYIVTELVEGESAQARLDREGALSEDEALRICIGAGEALAAAHAEGIVHRDVKPANILLRAKDGRVKLADLGLAKTLQEGPSLSTGLTASGQVMGTPAYMSPEQAADASKVDHRTDIYSLGATLYALVTAHPPFEESQVIATLMKVMKEPPRDVRELRPDISDATREVIARMMAKRPEDRPGAMLGALAEMRRARSQAPVARPGAGRQPPPEEAQAPPPEPAASPGRAAAEAGPRRAAEAPTARPPSSRGVLQAGPVSGTAAGSARTGRSGRVPSRASRALALAGLAAVLAAGTVSLLLARVERGPSVTIRETSDRAVVDLGDGVELAMLAVRPGRFTMGSNSGEPDERPEREIAITRPFFLGVTEVTRMQYGRVVKPSPGAETAPDDLPACVSWEDAARFCRRLSELTGRRFRLPTEAEWEYACRSGSRSAYSFGDSETALAEYGWFAANSGGAARPVGTRRPNAWGFHDMHGNVWEWCADWYDPGHYRSAPLRDPEGPASGTARAMRGGSVLFLAYDCRCSRRMSGPPNASFRDSGFRVALDPQQ